MTIRAVDEALVAAAIRHEIVVVNDNSSDGTANRPAASVGRGPVAALHQQQSAERLRLRGARRSVCLSRRRRGDRHGRWLGLAGRPRHLLREVVRRVRLRVRVALHRRSAGCRLSEIEAGPQPPGELFHPCALLDALQRRDQCVQVVSPFRDRRPAPAPRVSLQPDGRTSAEGNRAGHIRYAVVPTAWFNRTAGVSKFKIDEMGSRYLFIVFYCYLEKYLSREDYRKRLDPRRDQLQIWSR